MPHIDFIGEADYYNRLGSSKVSKKTTNNNVDIDLCSAVLNNSLLEPNECKILWNANPNKTYLYSVLYDGSTSYSPTISWGDLPQIDINNVQIFSGVSGVVGEAVLNGNSITFDRKYTGIPDDFSHTKPNLSINSPLVFMDFEGDTTTNPSKCDNHNTSEIILESVHEFGAKLESGSQIFEFTPPSGQVYSIDIPNIGQQKDPANANYLRIREKYLISITNLWRNGLMSSGLSVKLESIIEEVQMYQIIDDSLQFDPQQKKIIRVEYGFPISGLDELTLIRYTSSIQSEGSQNNSSFYKDLNSGFAEQLNIFIQRSQIQRPKPLGQGVIPVEDPVLRYYGGANTGAIELFDWPLIYNVPTISGRWE